MGSESALCWISIYSRGARQGSLDVQASCHYSTIGATRETRQSNPYVTIKNYATIQQMVQHAKLVSHSAGFRMNFLNFLFEKFN
jgi:hypothetical protein